MAGKKGFLQQLIIGKDKAEGFARASLPSNRWELFWDVLKGRFWKLVLLNLMILIALAAPIILLFLNYMTMSSVGSSLPFSSHIGVGYPVYPDIAMYGLQYNMGMSNSTFLLMIPALMFSGIILSGVFYIMRNLVWSEGVFIAPDFWKGLKDNIFHFMLIMLMEGVVLWLVNLTSNYVNLANYLGQGSFWLSLSQATFIILVVFFTVMCFYMMTLTVTYKLKFFQLTKNAFILTIGLLFQNVFFLVLCFAPILLMLLIPALASFGLMIYLMIGFSGAILGWTTFSHWVFDKFINGRIEGASKNRGIYNKVNLKGDPVSKKVKTSTLLKRRPLKHVTDEEIVLSELPTTFTRADLQKLAEEKENMVKDAENWSIEHEDDPDIIDDFIVYEEEAAEEKIIEKVEKPVEEKKKGKK